MAVEVVDATSCCNSTWTQLSSLLHSLMVYVPHSGLLSGVLEGGMPLEQEIAYYNSILDSLLQNHEGKFALIKGDKLIATFDRAENAYAEGVKRFGNQAFL